MAPGATTTRPGSTVMPRVPREVCGDRLAQLGEARRGAVARVAVAQRPGCGLDDVGRRVDAGLADLEVQHRAPLRLERAGACEHLEGGLGAEAVERLCEREGHVRPAYPCRRRCEWRTRILSYA